MKDNNWAKHEFDEIEFDDKRLDQRFVTVANQLSSNSVAPINQACQSWKDTKAAYRLFDNGKVTAEKIIESHQKKTVRRIGSQSLVFVIQDTTYLNYTHHPKKKGLGPIGALRDEQIGLMMHSALCISEADLPLGFLSINFQIRKSDNKKLNRYRPIEEKESIKWLTALEETHRLIPNGTTAVTIGDRESDICDLFLLAESLPEKILVRAKQDRNLCQESKYLWAFMEAKEPIGQKIISVPKAKNRKPRSATSEIKIATVDFRLPYRPGKAAGMKRKSISMQAILLKEINPPEDEKPLEWLLLTNIPVNNYDEACEKIEWYCKRWMIENFHKVLKSGCTVEDCRLETRERLERYLALSVVIGWRILWMTQIKRKSPDLPCTNIMTENEWQALYFFIHDKKSPPEKLPTVSDCLIWIAQLGGFMARKRDGDPGATVIWRGWQRFCDITRVWEITRCG
jgi:hypothetical protein